MDEDQILQSIIADPELTDPSIDVSQLRQTTETNPLLLANISEFPGLKFDPTQRSYIEDLYTLYGGGAPMVPVEDTAQIPAAIDTLVNVGGETSAMDQVTGGSILDTTPQDFGQSLVDQGIGVQATPTDPVVAPGEIPLTQDDFDDFNKIAVTPQTFADTGRADLLDQAGNVPGVGFATDFFPDIDTNVGTVLGKPGIERFDDAEAGIDITTEQAETPAAFDRPTIADVAGPVTLSRQDVVDTDANVGFIDAPILEAKDLDTQGNLLDTGLKKIRNIIPDFDPLVTAGKLALNTFVGKPVSLVIDALQALPSEDPADTLNRDIVDELKAEKDYGFNIQSGTLNQDPFGRNPVSLLGNYEQTLLEDATSTGTTKMALAKKEFAQDYFDKKADKTAPQEDVGAVPEDITPGVENIVDEFAPSDIQPTDPSLEITDRGRGDGGGGQDTGPVSTAGQAGPPSQRGGGADMGSVTTASAPPGRGGGSGGPPSQGGGSPGSGSGCVIATHAVNSGAFTKDTKREAVRWCVKNLHRTWWGEAIRKGYRYYGQKAINEGKAKNHYQEFKDYIAFGTGKRRTLKTGWTFVYRSIQFFIRGLIND